jgi:hypothetical protein
MMVWRISGVRILGVKFGRPLLDVSGCHFLAEKFFFLASYLWHNAYQGFRRKNPPRN